MASNDRPKALVKRTGPWKPGESGNPHGRPKGSRNAKTLAQQALIEGAMDVFVKNIKKVCEVAVARANEGDPAFVKMILDRVIPVRKAVEHSGSTGFQAIQIVVKGTETKVSQTEAIPAIDSTLADEDE